MPKINLHPLQFTITQANAISTIYTVPYGKMMDIYEITIANPTSVTVTVSMSGVTRPIQTLSCLQQIPRSLQTKTSALGM